MKNRERNRIVLTLGIGCALILWNFNRALHGQGSGWVWCGVTALVMFISVRSIRSPKGREAQTHYENFWEKRYGRFGVLVPYGTYILIFGALGLWKLTGWKIPAYVLCVLGVLYEIWLGPQKIREYREYFESRDIVE